MGQQRGMGQRRKEVRRENVRQIRGERKRVDTKIKKEDWR